MATTDSTQRDSLENPEEAREVQAPASTPAVTAFDSARDAYLESMAGVPAEALPYLKPGDDYSLGGLAVHVNFVLEHYTNVLAALVASGFAECRPEDPAGLEDRALARAREALKAEDVNGELARTKELHQGVAEMVGRLSADLTRSAPVWFPSATEAYPTSVNDVVGWLSDHYLEHVPHIDALLADWRRGGSSDPVAVVTEFGKAFARGDVDAVMALMTDDCVFENTYPPPDGERYVGQPAVREFWHRFFADTESPSFETEEIYGIDDHVVSRWRFSWGQAGSDGHVRGVDLIRVRDGKVSEKLSYVKG
jgi:ketosteroid isomerase-like protein